VLPAGETEAGWDSHPLKITAFSRHTSKNEKIEIKDKIPFEKAI